MLTETLPTDHEVYMSWTWDQWQPHFDELLATELTAENVDEWLVGWSELASRVSDIWSETRSRLEVATTLDTQDEDARQRYSTFLEGVFAKAREADNALTQKLLDSGLEPEGFDVPLRNLKAAADLFRVENMSLLAEDKKIGLRYDEIIGGQTIEWDGEEVTNAQLVTRVHSADRETREKAWRQMSQRVLEDRGAINAIWQELMPLRRQIADNAGKDTFLDYMWQDKNRFDYSPEDARSFHAAIEEVVVPAAARMYERRRLAWDVDTLRPWDVSVDALRTTELHGNPHGHPPIEPFANIAELEEVGARVFHKVHPKVGEYFETMRRESLLDLANYKGKAPGAYCTSYPVSKRPFVFQNATGTASDVDTLLHEAGHAFHVFQSGKLPYIQQTDSPMEFNEVASMAMELLATPYLTRDQGGFYTENEAARAMIEHLEGLLMFWPYMAVVDSFQHWVYLNHDEASEPSACDAKWSELWDRYIVGVDWSGLEDDKATGWHRKLHIFRVPLYYVEYGLAQLGAVQVWRNALVDQQKAVDDYLTALALGATVSLPELYETAGAKFAFDAGTLSEAIELIEDTIEQLQGSIY